MGDKRQPEPATQAELLKQQAEERAGERDRQLHNDELVKLHDPN
jgi:hypothetical protein